MKKCPFCGEEVQDAALKCKHCKEWLSKSDETAQPTGKAVLAGATPKAAILQNTHNVMKQWKAFSWKALIGAIFIAFILHVGVAIAMDSKPKQFAGTAMWIYLTILAWKYWGWKSLIPYPAYAVCIFVLNASLVSSGVDSGQILIVTWAMHIGGLIAFYIFLKKSADK